MIKRRELNQYDIDKQRERISDLYRRVKHSRLIQRDFDEALYFKYVKVEDEAADPLDKKAVNKAKLGGRFALSMNSSYSNDVKIRAFANDQLAFYMHKNGHFISKLSTSPTRVQLKKSSNNEMLVNLKKQFSNIEEEL